MNCPLCVERRLEPVHVDGVEIDVCENCGGVWLDRGELERMARPASTGKQPKAEKQSKGSKGSKAAEGKKPKKQKSLGSRLGDLLEEALDL